MILFTRVIYQAHMEQHIRIRTTEVTVMTKLYQKADKNPLELKAFTKLSKPMKVSVFGHWKTLLVVMARSALKEFEITITMG